MLFTATTHRLSALLALALLFLQASALPSFWPRRSFPQVNLRKRGLPGAVYICNDSDFKGDCSWIEPADAEKCHIAGTGNEAPLSIGPDPGGYCVLYEKSDCTGREIVTLKFPGYSASQVPSFGGLKCFVGDGAGHNTTMGGSVDAVAARLDGGTGSLKNRQLGEVLAAMKKDGFSEGFIGLEKRTYY